MKRRIMTLFLAAVLAAGSGVTAYAAPVRMADGTMFDAVYYAQNNPDVVGVLGTDADALYRHYQLFGKAEGRTPVAPGVNENSVSAYDDGSIYGPGLTAAELAQVNEVVKFFLASYNFAAMDDYQKIATAHQFLRTICNMPGYQQENKSDTAWGALVYHQAWSSGFARAMKVLCDAIGVECYYVKADSSVYDPNYRWNVVRAGGKYYIVDAYGNDRYETFNMYMVSDATFAKRTAMSWDRNSVPACLEDLPGTFRAVDQYGPENVGVYGVNIAFPYTRLDRLGRLWYYFGNDWYRIDYGDGGRDGWRF